MRELRPPEAREAERTNVGDSEQEVEAAACHTQGNHVRCPRGAQILSSVGVDPHFGHHRLLPTRVVGLFHQQKLIRKQTRSSGKALLGPLLKQRGVRTGNSFPCLLPEKKPTFYYLGVQSRVVVISCRGKRKNTRLCGSARSLPLAQVLSCCQHI